MNKERERLLDVMLYMYHLNPHFFYFLLLLRDTQGSKMLILHSLIILHYGEVALG